MVRHVTTRLAVGLLVASVVGACKSGDGPQVPTTFAASGGTSIQMTGVVASAVTSAPQVQILDAKGKGIKGLRVRWKVGANSGGVVNDSTLTDASGIALSGGWTLGTAAGQQTLTATADGVSPVTFTANVAPGPAANLVRISQDGQTATVNTNVPVAPSVRAQDTFGNPVPGVAVTFTAAVGGGSVDGATKTTDQSGIATVNSWKLGTTSGQQVVRANADGVTQAFFAATALPGPAADLQKAIGDAQNGVAGIVITTPPGVKVVDSFGNAVGGIPVTFTPGVNSGTVTGSTAQSDPANGIAIVGSWTLGTATNQTLIATSTSLPGKSATFTATATSTNFDINVRWVGDLPSAAIQAAVSRAINKWKSIVLNNVGTTRFTGPAQSCGRSWMPAVDTVVTNLLLYARIGTIDGVGNILGNANACAIHSATGLTGIGTMEFDSDDLTFLDSRGLMDAVLIHEMGHSLGFGGFFWTSKGLLTDGGLADPIFTGTQARAQFVGLGGDRYSGRIVPVENTGGAGTRDVHWRESVFNNELMTGFVNLGTNPLSRVTVGALADIGYAVSYLGADAFSFTTFLRSPFSTTESVVSLGNDVAPLTTPIAPHGPLAAKPVSPKK